MELFKDKTLVRISFSQHIHHENRSISSAFNARGKKIISKFPKVTPLNIKSKIWECEGASHHSTSLLWATARLLVTRVQSYLPSGGVLLQGSKSVGSVQYFILLFCVWCESRELGGRESFSCGFSCVTQVLETFSDRVALRILSNSDGAPLQKQLTTLTHTSRC